MGRGGGRYRGRREGGIEGEWGEGERGTVRRGGRERGKGEQEGLFLQERIVVNLFTHLVQMC